MSRQDGIPGQGKAPTTGAYSRKLENGQEWGFRLAANPVKRQVKSGKTWPHVTPVQQSAWLRERASQWGFEIIPAEGQELEDAPTVTGRNDLSFSRRDTGGHVGRVTLRKAQFDGALRITNVEQFRKALVNGMGRGKAYGMGLMTLAPLAQ